MWAVGVVMVAVGWLAHPVALSGHLGTGPGVMGCAWCLGASAVAISELVRACGNRGLALETLRVNAVPVLATALVLTAIWAGVLS
jgi:hypothetical protein